MGEHNIKEILCDENNSCGIVRKIHIISKKNSLNLKKNKKYIYIYYTMKMHFNQSIN